MPGHVRLRSWFWSGTAGAGCAVFLAIPALQAQDQAQTQDSLQLEPIVVQGAGREDPKAPVSGYVATTSSTASKTGTPLVETPQSISVITADQLKAQGAQTLGQALNYTPGVVGEPFGADPRFDSPTIRGFDGRQSQFLNGLKLMRTAGAPAIELYGLERVEVLRGPSSVLYGQGNPGGLINMVSKRPVFEPFGEVGAQFGSFDTYEGTFDLGGPIGQDDTLAYRVTGLVRNGGEQTDHLDNDRYFLAPALTWKPDADTTFTVLTSVQHDNPSAPSGLPAALTLNANGNKLPRDFFVGDKDFNESSRTLANLGYEFEHRFADRWFVRQNFRYSNFDWNYQDAYFSSLAADGHTLNRGAIYQRESLNTVNVDNQVQGSFSTGPVDHTLLMGLDVRYLDNRTRTEFGLAPALDSDHPDYSMSIPKNVWYKADVRSNLWQVGLYGQDELALDRWRLTLGLRQDWATSSSTTDYLTRTSAVDQDDSKLTGRAGLSYLFDNGIAPYISYATSFEPVVSQNASGNALVPTTGEQVEAGIKYQPPGWNGFFTAAVYDLRQKNVLTTVVTDGVTTDEQIGEVHVQGVELEAVASLTEGLDLRGAYTYTKARVIGGEDDGNRPQNVPEHAASLWLDYTHHQGGSAWDGLGIGGGVRYIGQRFGDADNTYDMDGVTLFDASIHYQWDRYRASLNVSNIADRNYVANCGSFGCYYGDGRTIMGKLSYAW